MLPERATLRPVLRGEETGRARARFGGLGVTGIAESAMAMLDAMLAETTSRLYCAKMLTA
jgi:hypothetical protein